MERGDVRGSRGIDRVLANSVALGALTGLRSVAASALLSHELADARDRQPSGGLADLLATPTASRVLALLASGEMLADKTSLVGDRVSPIPLTGRAIMGSLTAAAFAGSQRRPVLLPAVLGAAAAIATAYAAFHLRRLAAEHFEVPDRVLGMVEDAVVIAASRGIASAMEG